jgi:predicted HAD superfamily hydrolase
MQIHSFDVFDTCITRTFAHPRDLFYALGRHVAPGGLDAKALHRFASQFQRRRIQAEKAAYRRASRLEGVSIAGIYSHFRPLPGLQLTQAELIRAEVALERQSLYPVAAALFLVNRLRDAGNRIIFVSDMYLPAAVLEQILLEHGFMRRGDALYVSCDVGCSKLEGRLFDHVLTTEGIGPQDLVHHGDDHLCDVLMARKHGIEAHHVTGGSLNRLERRIAVDRTWRKLPRPTGDSFLAGFARRVRLQGGMESGVIPDELTSIQCTVVVPLLLTYVEWLLDYARSENIARLYFVARDGHVLLSIAKELVRPADGPQLRYLYGSRRAWTLPSWPWNDVSFDRTILLAGKRSTPEQILRRLNLDDGCVRDVLHAMSISEGARQEPLSRAGCTAFMEKLRSNEVAGALVASAAASARGNALDYFAQEDMVDGHSWALVDSGWGLNAQAALKRVLSGVTDAPRVRGIYLALARNHLSAEQAGTAACFAAPAGRLLASRTHLMDHCFFPAPHASTRRYVRQGDTVQPEFDEATREPLQLAYANQLDKLARAAARLLANDTSLRAEFRTHTPTIVAAAERFISAPDQVSVTALAQFCVQPDVRQERDGAEPLCRPLRARDLAVIGASVLSEKARFKATPHRWLEGSMAISAPWIRWPMNAALGIAHMRRRWLLRPRA